MNGNHDDGDGVPFFAEFALPPAPFFCGTDTPQQEKAVVNDEAW